MKFRPIYIYLFGIVLAVGVFFFVSRDSGTSVPPSQNEIANKQMPQDEIHSGLKNPDGQTPSKDNVSDMAKEQLANLKKAVEESPNDTLKLKQYADFLAAAHMPDQALEYYNKILKLYPKRTDIAFSVAYINYTERKFDVAEKLLQNVLSYDKNNLQAYYNLGAIAYSSGNKDKAKQIWTKLAKEHPKTQMGDMAQKSLEQM